jgi:hypothetical protein
VAFSQTIPLDNNAAMPQTTVSGALTFSPAGGPVSGGQCYLRIIADGTNAPNFSAFREWGGSLGYDNRAGIVNQVTFFYDGYDYWYSASQAVGAVAVVVDSTAPTLLSASVSDVARSTVAIAVSESLDAGFVPAASAFTVGGHTVSAVGVSGSTISLTVSAPFANGEAARTVAYAQPGTNNIRDTSGNLLANSSGLAITNNVQPSDSTAPSFVSAQVANASPTVIAITMSEALAAITPAASAFAVSGGKTVSSVSISGSVVNVTVNTAYANGDAITVAYTQPGSNKLQDGAGNFTATFGAQSVTNNIASAGPSAGRFSQLANIVESGTAPNYIYTSTSGAPPASYTGQGILTKSLPASGDGSITMRVNRTSNSEFIWGLTTSSTPVGFANVAYGVYVPSSGIYQKLSSGTPGTADNSTETFVNNDLIRITRTGSTIVMAASHNAGSSWATINTWSGASTAQLYVALCINVNLVVDQVSILGLT